MLLCSLDDIAQWRGLEPLLWVLVDRPDFMLLLIRKLAYIRLKMLNIAECRLLSQQHTRGIDIEGYQFC